MQRTSICRMTRCQASTPNWYEYLFITISDLSLQRRRIFLPQGHLRHVAQSIQVHAPSLKMLPDTPESKAKWHSS